jgi:UDP-galactopyranose mutase
MDNIVVYDYLIVGAGLSGSVIAERLAQNNKKILIIDKRDHIGGNCYDYFDDNDILINKYGAHIFHTNNEIVWKYINKFSEWVRWDHKVLSFVDNKYVSVPVNINTVNSLCNENIQNENEMNNWLEKNQVKYDNIENSEDVAKSRVGVELYEKMFKPYTIKQWNKDPCELDKSVLSRIPIRNNFDDRYFNDKYQVLPKFGYTHFIKNILNHTNITVMLNTDFFNLDTLTCNFKWNNLVYTGPIDMYFNKLLNKNTKNSNIDENDNALEYRSIEFIIESYKNMNYYQPASVVNYPGLDVPFTRIVEYKHFSNQKSNITNTTIVKEITKDSGEPYYPVPTEKNLLIYEKLRLLAESERINNNVHFIGRLANYKYFNMDEAIKNALEYYDNYFADI